MTDERLGDLLAVVAMLPRGSGVVFRHYSLPPRQRRALFVQVRRIAMRRQLTLVVAGPDRRLRGAGLHGGWHGRSGKHRGGLRTVPVHDAREMTLARRLRADLVFVSPVFATRSHPGARPLGVVRLGLMLGAMRTRAVALGGMDAARWRRVRVLKLHGWAAIDALNHAASPRRRPGSRPLVIKTVRNEKGAGPRPLPG